MPVDLLGGRADLPISAAPYSRHETAQIHTTSLSAIPAAVNLILSRLGQISAVAEPLESRFLLKIYTFFWVLIQKNGRKLLFFSISP
jgi:hypothetical protein